MNSKDKDKKTVEKKKTNEPKPVQNEKKKAKTGASQDANVSMDDRCLVANTAEDARPDNGGFCHDGRDGE